MWGLFNIKAKPSGLTSFGLDVKIFAPTPRMLQQQKGNFLLLSDLYSLRSSIEKKRMPSKYCMLRWQILFLNIF